MSTLIPHLLQSHNILFFSGIDIIIRAIDRIDFIPVSHIQLTAIDKTFLNPRAKTFHFGKGFVFYRDEDVISLFVLLNLTRTKCTGMSNPSPVGKYRDHIKNLSGIRIPVLGLSSTIDIAGDFDLKIFEIGHLLTSHVCINEMPLYRIEEKRQQLFRFF